MMKALKIFTELRDEFQKNNDEDSFYIFKQLFAHWLLYKDQTVCRIYIKGFSSRHLVLTDNILSHLGYHHYSIDFSDPEVMIIKLCNSL